MCVSGLYLRGQVMLLRLQAMLSFYVVFVSLDVVTGPF
jgi:hypothetical protein